MRSLVSPSLAVSAAASTTVRPPGTLPILPVSRRPPCLPRLKLLPSEAATLCRPRFVPARAQQYYYGHGSNFHPHVEPNHFVEERAHIWRHYFKIHCDAFGGVLFCDAIAMSGQVCILAIRAIAVASKVVNSASLTLLSPDNDGISKDTVHRTLRAYVDVFLRTADDCYNKSLKKKTVISFLGALRGLASISHILLEAALEALGHTHPRESLSEYAYDYDVKIMHREFNWQITGLEDGIRNTPTNKQACKLVLPTIFEGVKATESLVRLMVARRQRALGKANK